MYNTGALWFGKYCITDCDWEKTCRVHQTCGSICPYSARRKRSRREGWRTGTSDQEVKRTRGDGETEEDSPTTQANCLNWPHGWASPAVTPHSPHIDAMNVREEEILEKNNRWVYRENTGSLARESGPCQIWIGTSWLGKCHCLAENVNSFFST